MRLLVIYNAHGTILSLGPVQPAPERGRLPEPRLLEGQHAAELDVPESHASAPLLDIHHTFRVELKAGPPHLAARA